MIRNHLVTACRNLIRNKSFSLINILGLTLGMTACTLILYFVSFEWSFDSFHPNADRLYRVNFKRYDNGALSYTSAMNVPNTAPVLNETFPEVEESGRLYSLRSNFTCTLSSYDGKEQGQTFNEKDIFFADASAIRLFDVPVISGDERALEQPFTAVVTESTAKKYFGTTDPLGKIIQLNCLIKEKFRIAAVIRDLPENTHLQIDVLLSYSTLRHTEAAARTNDNWGNESVLTYLTLREGTDVQAFQKKLDLFVKEQVAKPDNTIAFELQPIKNIHLQSGVMDEIKPAGNPTIGKFLLITAAFILILAWINYTNLTTARVFQRAKEVGLRKITGAGTHQIFTQFLVESFLVNGIALLLSVVLIQTAAPSFLKLVGVDTNFTFSIITLPFYLLLVFFFLGTLVSGGYAASVLTTGNPVNLFKGTYRTVRKNSLQQGLVAIQFVVSISLIIGTVVVFQQLSFMRNQDLGIAINHTFLVITPSVVDSTYYERLQHFKTDMLANSHVRYVTTSAIVPGTDNTWLADVKRQKDDVEKTSLGVNIVDSDYLEAFSVSILAGRNFTASEQRKGDRFGEELERVIVNKSAALSIGYATPEDAVNERIYWNNNECVIVGVVDDFHQRSLHYTVQPSLFVLDNRNSVYYAIKFNSTALSNSAIVSLVHETYVKNFPGNPFDYFFLEDSFDKQYHSDQQFGTVFGVFSALTIFIACLGMYGLVSYNIIQRTKEVGIRKILGASAIYLQALLLRRYLKLIAIAFVIAAPATFWLCDEWLRTFAYHIHPQAWMFIIPGVLVMLVALLSVCVKSFRAVTTNPVDALRAE